MDLLLDLLPLLIALIALAAVAWLELRYIKGKRRGTPERDLAYSTLATFRAVEGSLRANGHNTVKAYALLDRAEGAYVQGRYDECLELSRDARDALHGAPAYDDSQVPSMCSSTGKGSSSDRGTGPIEAPSGRFQGSQPHHLEAKFIIESTSGMLDDTPERMRKDAQRMPYEARARIDTDRYTDARSQAAKARESLRGHEAIISTRSAEARLRSDDVSDPICPYCETNAALGDYFCRVCGARL